jgi:hypothetical protein
MGQEDDVAELKRLYDLSIKIRQQEDQISLEILRTILRTLKRMMDDGDTDLVHTALEREIERLERRQTGARH